MSQPHTWFRFLLQGNNMPKLDLLTSSNSTSVVFSALRQLTGDTSYASFAGVVSAKVNGVLKIDKEEITVQLTNSRPNFAIIDIHWEDCGYKNYKEMGLFGRMTTEWNDVKSTSARSFSVFSDSYEIEICY
ncbi:hypothetical protein ISH43_09770 [Pseudomonas aeruginosa]|uniref:hypothetical protein n=1 Tax=Pseudomonas aeruginosa TaxID=287 RepID=UPI0010679FEC|nr:hypothetical protein [Pseudomonas aeruginosa]EKU2243430.1 hypothetical protein [Pseudomonas aeruginosa]ELS4621178.1 hypothetical protein [Pseudomonas aeruginosa]MBG3963202.1 hypothetical protein [Pseudomonas aeruginosa]MBG6933677.1 hypothetical protein [Pseudomonas aeruginosa]MBG6944242.1 hypothetical protein [Pseudomonas aeruginosa]